MSGTPHERGRTHGAAHAAEIQAYAADRAALVVAGTTLNPTDGLSLVEESITAHATYAPDLFQETEGLAAAAGISVAEALLVSGYTDFLDVVRARAGSAGHDDDCTAMLVPAGVAPGGALLAQTWDMHASATPHVVLLSVLDRLEALVFTTLGCIGQIGLNAAGIAIGINNLSSTDGTAGVTWPFVVRKVLQQDDIEAALECVVEAPLAGAHNFLVLAGDGRGYNVEATPTERVVTPLGRHPLLHTNHCLSSATRRVEAVRDVGLSRSSVDRLSDAGELLGPGPVTVEHVMKVTADERSICRHPDPVFHYETCGAAIMRPSSGDFWACWGRPSESEYEHHRVGA